MARKCHQETKPEYYPWVLVYWCIRKTLLQCKIPMNYIQCPFPEDVLRQMKTIRRSIKIYILYPSGQDHIFLHTGCKRMQQAKNLWHLQSLIKFSSEGCWVSSKWGRFQPWENQCQPHIKEEEWVKKQLQRWAEEGLLELKKEWLIYNAWSPLAFIKG